MDPFANIAAISHVSLRCVKHAARRGCGTSLDRQPGGEIGHVVDAGNGRSYALTYPVRPEIAFLVPELRHQRSISIPGGRTAKQQLWCNLAVLILGPLKIGAKGGQI